MHLQENQAAPITASKFRNNTEENSKESTPPRRSAQSVKIRYASGQKTLGWGGVKAEVEDILVFPNVLTDLKARHKASRVTLVFNRVNAEQEAATRK
jgi:hypothetical protein